MFFGAVPTACIEQVFKIIDFTKWQKAYVCCSGSFRIERALRKEFPELQIYSNDVSLYSSALGFLNSGKEIEISFDKELSFINECKEIKNYF